MAKQPSLAAQTGTLEKSEAPGVTLALPDIFKAPIEDVKGRFIAPYITFAHPRRADEWKKLTAKLGNSITEGDMFLIEQDVITPLPTAKLGLLKAKQFWAEVNPAGEIQRVSWLEQPWKEHIDAVVLVYFADRIVPANVRAKTTKCPAFKALNDALKEAGTAEWADKGAAFKETLILQQAFCRFYGEVTLGAPRSGKTSGLPYRPTQCTIQPTSVPEWRLLTDFSASETSQKALNDAANRFIFGMTELAKKQIAPQAA